MNTPTFFNTSKIQIIVLAAGAGKRIKNKNLPKILLSLKGKPIIQHLLTAIKKSGVCKKPVIVIGQKADQVKAALRSDYTYIFQAEQLGTGHAVACTRQQLEGKVKDIMVLYGDHPFVSAKTIRKLTDTHLKEGKVLTMATTKVVNFADWRQGFFNFGRIIRNEKGKVSQIVEFKDATDRQKEIKEINPAYFCFKADWLWQNLNKLKNDNAQQEYYLTDLVSFACQQRQDISPVEIEPKEALGVNTIEELKLLKNII